METVKIDIFNFELKKEEDRFYFEINLNNEPTKLILRNLTDDEIKKFRLFGEYAKLSESISEIGFYFEINEDSEIYQQSLKIKSLIVHHYLSEKDDEFDLVYKRFNKMFFNIDSLPTVKGF